MRNIKFATAIFLLLLPFYSYSAIQNICQVIKSHPSWYKAAKLSDKKWGVPVPVQLAIIHEESHFKANAKNPSSTAFGYAQVINQVWHSYKVRTDSYAQKRDVFADAANFIGWYAHRMKKQVHISPHNAFALYLAYHDGGAGYLQDLRGHYDPMLTLADHVQYVANIYQRELIAC